MFSFYIKFSIMLQSHLSLLEVRDLLMFNFKLKPAIAAHQLMISFFLKSPGRFSSDGVQL